MGSKNRKHLIWIYQRLESIHRENINSDYMIKFKEIIDDMTKKERHDQQVDSGDNYDEVLESPVGMISYQEEKPYTPQVGEECEYETTFFSLDKSNSGKCKIIAYHNDRVWIDMADGGEAVINMKVIEFRPLKTERDKLLEQAVSNFSESELAIEENIKATCYRLIDAGWRPTNDY